MKIPPNSQIKLSLLQAISETFRKYSTKIQRWIDERKFKLQCAVHTNPKTD